MTDIELLFREQGRSEPISYEEFLCAGWKLEDYLQYLQICEDIRAFTILRSKYLRKPSSKCTPQMIESIFETVKGALCGFLSTHFERKLTLGWKADFIPYIYAVVPKFTYSNEKFARYACDIYISCDDFRFNIERYIYMAITEDYSLIFGDKMERISSSVISEQIERFKKLQIGNMEPQMPKNMNSYAALQTWASEYDSYLDIEYNCDDYIEDLQDALNMRFSLDKNVLYVYSAAPNCVKNHDTESVTIQIPTLDGKVASLNATYCKDCGKFFITYSEYEIYYEKYRFLPIRLVKIDNSPNHSQGLFDDMKEQSELMLCGYSVREGGPTCEERHELLAFLMDAGVFNKGYIYNFIEGLIDRNGSKAQNRNAVDKWVCDLKFVLDYNINEQRRAEINKVLSASSRIQTKSIL